jgi:hypothetical protein
LGRVKTKPKKTLEENQGKRARHSVTKEATLDTSGWFKNSSNKLSYPHRNLLKVWVGDSYPGLPQEEYANLLHLKRQMGLILGT